MYAAPAVEGLHFTYNEIQQDNYYLLLSLEEGIFYPALPDLCVSLTHREQ